jgi:hypothetical protein
MFVSKFSIAQNHRKLRLQTDVDGLQFVNVLGNSTDYQQALHMRAIMGDRVVKRIKVIISSNYCHTISTVASS